MTAEQYHVLIDGKTTGAVSAAHVGGLLADASFRRKGFVKFPAAAEWVRAADVALAPDGTTITRLSSEFSSAMRSLQQFKRYAEIVFLPGSALSGAVIVAGIVLLRAEPPETAIWTIAAGLAGAALCLLGLGFCHALADVGQVIVRTEIDHHLKHNTTKPPKPMTESD
ncbi:MAG: hypothetical protein CMJ46_11515 [Planctomyces sp.]|nr:hypothetical protein [Planctomyces sp.]